MMGDFALSFPAPRRYYFNIVENAYSACGLCCGQSDYSYTLIPALRMSPHVAGLSANVRKTAGPKPPVSLTTALSIGEIRSALAASAAANRDWYDRERPIG
jgi:hypothetical protein